MMATSVETRPWDFSRALELVNAMWTSPELEMTTHTPATAALINIEPEPSRRDFATASNANSSAVASTDNIGLSQSERDQSHDSRGQLGRLPGVFQYLGAKNKSPSAGTELAFGDCFPIKADYASDGATYVGISGPKSGKVRWQDETDIDDGNVATDRSASPPRLSKKARWRRNKRLQKASFTDSPPDNSSQQHVLVSDSEADRINKKTPARKASVHFIRSDSAPSLNLHSRVAETPSHSSIPPVTVEGRDWRTQPNVQRQLSPIPDEDGKDLFNRKVHEEAKDYKHETVSLDPPVTPKSNLRFTPASVQPSRVTSAPVHQSPNLPASTTNTPRRNPYSIEPTILRSGEDRNWALLLKLIHDFPQDRGFLVSPMNLTTHNNNPKGIHVFVDASNIFIGFMEQLRRSHNIPQRAHVKKVEPSFDALALLIERRRPVSRRVLAGSSPENTAFDKARAVGYQCSILEKVWKARELTKRQIFFRDKEAGLIDPRAKPPPHATRTENQDHSSGTDTATPQFAPASFVEQGVDEIIHMKMMESMLDCEEPTTMVLATGDAAAAEYSDGFMAMVERALKRGWKVELYSWSKNINSLYKSPKFLNQWESQFKIVYLDDFAELLLDM